MPPHAEDSGSGPRKRQGVASETEESAVPFPDWPMCQSAGWTWWGRGDPSASPMNVPATRCINAKCVCRRRPHGSCCSCQQSGSVLERHDAPRMTCVCVTVTAHQGCHALQQAQLAEEAPSSDRSLSGHCGQSQTRIPWEEALRQTLEFA